MRPVTKIDPVFRMQTKLTEKKLMCSTNGSDYRVPYPIHLTMHRAHMGCDGVDGWMTVDT